MKPFNCPITGFDCVTCDSADQCQLARKRYFPEPTGAVDRTQARMADAFKSALADDDLAEVRAFVEAYDGLPQSEDATFRYLMQTLEAHDKALMAERGRWLKATLPRHGEVWSHEAMKVGAMICQRALSEDQR